MRKNGAHRIISHLSTTFFTVCCFTVQVTWHKNCHSQRLLNWIGVGDTGRIKFDTIPITFS